MNWYRVKVPHDTFGARDVGRLVLLEGTVREASLEKMGYLELIGDAGDPPQEMLDYLESVGPVMAADNPPEPRKRRRRGEQAEAGPVPGPDVRDAGDEPARAGHLPTD